MQNLVEYIAKWIVDDPDAMRVSERRRGDRLIVRLDVAESDLGRVIGRGGRAASAMRTLLRISAQQRGREASLEIR